MKLFKFLKNKQKLETCKHKGFNQFSLLRTRGAKTYSSYAVSCNKFLFFFFVAKLLYNLKCPSVRNVFGET